MLALLTRLILKVAPCSRFYSKLFPFEQLIHLYASCREKNERLTCGIFRQQTFFSIFIASLFAFRALRSEKKKKKEFSSRFKKCFKLFHPQDKHSMTILMTESGARERNHNSLTGNFQWAPTGSRTPGRHQLIYLFLKLFDLLTCNV
jgi:hypothetical protein